MRHSLLSSPGSGVSVAAGQNPPCGHVQSPVTGLEPPSQCRPELWTAEHSTPSLTDHNSHPTVPSLVRKRSEDTEPVSKGGRPCGASVAVAEDGARLPGPHRVRPADEARCPALGLPRAVRVLHVCWGPKSRSRRGERPGQGHRSGARCCHRATQGQPGDAGVTPCPPRDCSSPAWDVLLPTPLAGGRHAFKAVSLPCPWGQ